MSSGSVALIFFRILHGVLQQQPVVHQPGVGGLHGGVTDHLRLRDLHQTVCGVLVVQHVLNILVFGIFSS